MRAKSIAAPMGGFSLKAGSILLLGFFFYVFLGSAPVTSIANLHASFGVGGLITLDTFFALGHMAAYGVLTLGLCTIFKSASARPAIAATLTGVGVGIEILQEEFFGRQFHLLDVAANVAGIAAAMIFLAIVTRGSSRPAHRS